MRSHIERRAGARGERCRAKCNRQDEKVRMTERLDKQNPRARGADARATQARPGAYQFSIFHALVALAAVSMTLAASVNLGQAGATLAIIIVAFAVIAYRRYRDRPYGSDLMAGLCAAAALGLCVGYFRLGATILGFWLTSLVALGDSIGLERGVGGALAMSVAFLGAYFAFRAIIGLSPQAPRAAGLGIVALFLAPTAAFVGTVAWLAARETPWPASYRAALVAINLLSIAFNLIFVRVILTAIRGGHNRRAGRWGAVLLLLDLFAVMLAACPLTDGT